MSDVDSAIRRSARSHLVAVGWFAACGLSLSAVHAITGFGIGCPLRHFTGILCPFCGATRMGSDLLVGDLSGAWIANPFVLVGLGVLGLATASWTVSALGGPQLRPPGLLGDRRTWIWVVGITAAVFMVVRNVLAH